MTRKKILNSIIVFATFFLIGIGVGSDSKAADSNGSNYALTFNNKHSTNNPTANNENNFLLNIKKTGLVIFDYLINYYETNNTNKTSNLYNYPRIKESSQNFVSSDDKKKPNVIFILTDDQYKNSFNPTTMPNTWDFIKKQGTILPNHVLPIPTCCPSRSSFLSGQYGHNNSVENNGGAHGGFANYYSGQRDRGLGWGYNIGSFMKNGGYRTAIMGKYLNNYGDNYKNNIPGTAPNPVPGWDKWFVTIKNKGQKYYNYRVKFNGSARSLGPDRRATEDTWIDKFNKVIHFPAPKCDLPDGCLSRPDIINKQKRSYSEHIYVNQAISFLKRNRSEKPSFVWYAADTPHGTGDKTIYNHKGTWGSASYSPDDQFKFNDAPFKRLIPSPAFNEKRVKSKPLYIKRAKRFGLDKRNKITLHSKARWKSLYSLDRELGRLYKYLKKSGKANNTILVFTSDNGFMSGEHRIPKGKVRPYTEVSEFPILYRGPGIKKNVSVPILTANIDFLPTILNLTGVPKSAVRDPFSNRSNPIDGIDISSYLEQNSTPQISKRKGILISSTPGYDIKPFKPYRGVRSRDFLYVRYYKKNNFKEFFNCRDENECISGLPELYNLKKDPYQRNNLAFHIKKNSNNIAWINRHQSLLNKLSEMERTFHRLRWCSGESCRK